MNETLHDIFGLKAKEQRSVDLFTLFHLRGGNKKKMILVATLIKECDKDYDPEYWIGDDTPMPFLIEVYSILRGVDKFLERILQEHKMTSDALPIGKASKKISYSKEQEFSIQTLMFALDELENILKNSFYIAIGWSRDIM